MTVDKSIENMEILEQGEISPEHVMMLVKRVSLSVATDREQSAVERLKSRVLDAYVSVKRETRTRQHLALLKWIQTASVGHVCEALDMYPQTMRAWRDTFIDFAADFFNAEWKTRHARRTEFKRWKETLDTYCALTHQQSGGRGGTPPIGRREFSAGACPACADKAAIIGRP